TGKGPIGPFPVSCPLGRVAWFYSATLAWNCSAVDTRRRHGEPIDPRQDRGDSKKLTRVVGWLLANPAGPTKHNPQPRLLPGLGAWIDAFWELSTERQIGMGSGPIPSHAIDRWAERLGAELGMFRAAVRAMDRVYLDHINTPADEHAARQTVSDRPVTTELIGALFGAR
ncbi:phage tail assembly chaperone, partial [Aureimonas glaciei]|uniref:phage tail assembly chaperone n=1 Tax=Aureimonas glaciei TaxID=1776957 RepID=UPI001AEE3ECC